jgi:adenylate cyclase, class 2
MPARRPTNREIEIKLRVSDVEDTLSKLRNVGARYESRVLERNTLYDTPDSDFRRRGAVLRLRHETPATRPARVYTNDSRPKSRTAVRTILTSKAPSSLRVRKSRHRYKEKFERELILRDSPAGWDRILRSLGLRPGFRYEKYRTTFRLPGLALELDETPAGTFLELEGTPRAIDRAARALGYSIRDYYRGTYWDVYAADCRRRGRTPRNMLFHSKKIR